MKANNIILLLACSLASILVSCSDSMPYSEEAYNNTWIEVYPEYITLKEDEFNGEFTVNSSHNWYVSDCSSWINIQNSYGYGYEFVSFTVDENEGSSDRYGYIKLKTDDSFTKETQVLISQPPTPQLEVTMYSTNFAAAGEWKYLYINAGKNKNWTISKSDYWVHFGYSSNTSYTYSGKGNDDIQIYVEKNNSTESRSAKLTVSCGNKTKSITITQEAKKNNAPFTITSVSIANIENGGKIINDYGSVIYSYKTKYLRPKLFINVIKTGTFTIYTKLYTPDGILSTGNISPSGYTYKTDVYINSYTTSVELLGWGGNNAGHWKAGKYRWEFWYNSEKIGEKSFTIY